MTRKQKDNIKKLEIYLKKINKLKCRNQERAKKSPNLYNDVFQ